MHKATEDCDIDGVDSPGEAKEYFLALWESRMRELEANGIALTDIKAGGRKSESWPNKENHQWWWTFGQQMVADYVAWRQARLAEGWAYFPLPNGKPAIEVPVQVEFDDVLVKGYIDRVFINSDGEVVVVDLKSGSRTPESTLQLGVYALGMGRNFGVHPSVGGYYMTRKAGVGQYHSLLHYTHDLLGGWFSAAKRGIEAEVFVPKVTALCNSCSVAPYCTAVGGDPSPLTRTSFAS